MVAAPEALERPLPVGRVEARPLVTDGDEREPSDGRTVTVMRAACRTVQAAFCTRFADRPLERGPIAANM